MLGHKEVEFKEEALEMERLSLKIETLSSISK